MTDDSNPIELVCATCPKVFRLPGPVTMGAYNPNDTKPTDGDLIEARWTVTDDGWICDECSPADE